jgi:CDP-diacylglycerol--serine O-phosphatidyltransferase
MPNLRLSERLIDPRSPDRRPRRAAYALPTLFTAGNILLGFISILESFRGTGLPWGPNPHFDFAALLIGIAFALDGLDGRIARMTNTVSDFGREMDSLADVITFGLAPAILAFTWGFWYIPDSSQLHEQILRAAYVATFLFLLCGSLRLARFNIQTNPVPRNPGRPDRKYFVGLPIPAAAGALASAVYAVNGTPINWWVLSLPWLAFLGLLAFLMVSTWRYRSFKDLNLLRPHSPVSLVLLGAFVILIWNYSKLVLPAMAGAYVASGIVIRLGGIVRRRFRRSGPPAPVTSHA